MNYSNCPAPVRGELPVAVGIVALVVGPTVLPTMPSFLLLIGLTAGIGAFGYVLRNYLVTILSLGLLVRLGIIAIDRSVRILPQPPVAPAHDRRATQLAATWKAGDPVSHLPELVTMPGLMAHVLAPFYVLLGPAPIAGRVAIALVSVLTGYITFRIARDVTNRDTAVLAGGLVVFWPTILYRSVVIQREIVMAAALLGILWATLQWLDSVTLVSVIVAAAGVGMTYALRMENLLVVAATVGCLCLLKSRDRPHYLAGIVLGTVPFFGYFVLNFDRFTGYGTTLSPATLDAYAYGRAHGDAVYLEGLHYETWIDVALYAPTKIVYFLYTPFPWHVSSPVEMIVGVSAIGLLLATLLARRGIGLLQKEPEYLTLLLVYLAIGVTTYAVVEMNYGAAVRRRIQFVPIILLLAAIGLSNVSIGIRGRNG